MPAKKLVSLSSLPCNLAATVDETESREFVFQAIQGLSSRLAQVVILKYYGDDGKPWTLKQIGNRLGITDERVRQLLKRAYFHLQPVSRELLQP